MLLATVLLFSFVSMGYADDAIEHIQNTSVTIKSGSSEGSGNIITREIVIKDDKKAKVNFILTAGHVIDDLRTVREIVDTDGTSKKIIEFKDASIVKEFRQKGRRVGETKLDAKVLKFSDADNGEDLALLMVLMYDFCDEGVEFYLSEDIPNVGTELIHCGSLLGQMGANSMTTGIMSQIGRVYKGVTYDQTTVTAFPGSCLPKNAKISMADGTFKKIIDIKQDDRVLGYNTKNIAQSSLGKYNIHPYKVLKFINAGIKEVYEIRTNNRTLRASGNHPVVKVITVLNFDNKVVNIPVWCRVDQLQHNDIMAVMYDNTHSIKFIGNIEFVPHDLKYERINSVSLSSVETTYDLSIEGCHNFFADGVLVHNSGGGVFLKTGDKAQYVGMVVRGSGETFNLMVPVRRVVQWAKDNDIEWIVNSQKPAPTMDDILKMSIEVGYKKNSKSKTSQTTDPKDGEENLIFMDGEHKREWLKIPVEPS